MVNRKLLTIVALVIIFAFAIGMVFGVIVTRLPTETKGFFTMQEGSTQLRILSIQNQIMNMTKLKTTVTIQNPTNASISFNATVSFYDGFEVELLSYTLSGTLLGSQQKNYVNTNVLNITAWDNTGIDLTATG